jgi:hypothetical protein
MADCLMSGARFRQPQAMQRRIERHQECHSQVLLSEAVEMLLVALESSWVLPRLSGSIGDGKQAGFQGLIAWARHPVCLQHEYHFKQ